MSDVTITILRIETDAWTFTASDSPEDEPVFTRKDELMDWIEFGYILPPHSVEYAKDVLELDLGAPAPIYGAARRLFE